MEKIFYEGVSGKFPYRSRSFDRLISRIDGMKKTSIGLDNYQQWVYQNAVITYINDEENVKVTISGEEDQFVDIEDQIVDVEEIIKGEIESELERISTKVRVKV